MRLRLHARAEEETLAAAAWYEEQREGLGEELLVEVDNALTTVLEAPALWPVWPNGPIRQPPIQRFLLRRFPFAIGYQHFPEEIVVLSITHTSRRPMYWSSRKP